MADSTPTPRVDLEELVAEGRRLLHDAPISKRRETTWLRWCDDHAADLLEAVEYAGRCEKALREATEILYPLMVDEALDGAYCPEPTPSPIGEAVTSLRAALARPHPDEEAGR